jgi:hypothetical protein
MPDETTTVAAPAETPVAAVAAQGPERSLADYMADHMEQVARNAGREAGSKETPAVPVEPAAAPVAAPAAEPATPVEPEVPAAPPVPPPQDERAAALAEYIRGKRQNKAESIRLKAESERIKTEMARVAEREAAASKILALKELAAKDPVRAAEEFLGKEKFGNDFLLAALDRVAKGDTERPLTDEERQEVITEAATAKIRAELKAEAEAAAEKAQQEAAQASEEGKSRYFGQVSAHLRANAAQYPMMAAEGWPTGEISAAVEAHHAATGLWPTADQVLGHFEALHTARADRLLKLRQTSSPTAAPAPKPLSSSPAAAPVRTMVDSGGRAGKKIEEGTYEERRKAIQARLDGRIPG